MSVIELIGDLPKSKAGEVIARQLLRSATSIGANYREANRAESSDDFIHKIGISEKEAAETEYWLELILRSQRSCPPKVADLRNECRELLAILVAIARSAKAGIQEKRRSESENRKP